MNEKRIPLQQEELKYKKKSKAKGLSRSKHKHEYIPVLLHRPWENPYKNNEITELVSVNKVCKICGRIDACVNDDSYYEVDAIKIGKFHIGQRKFSKKALSLPKWYTHDYWDKFAHRGE